MKAGLNDLKSIMHAMQQIAQSQLQVNCQTLLDLFLLTSDE